MAVKIKMCGISTPEEVDLINSVQPDYMGIVMYFPKSRRNVAPERAAELIARTDVGIRKVAVVVSPTVEQMTEIGKLGFDIVQIHGEVRDALIENCPLPVWKAFNVKDMDDYDWYRGFSNVSGYVFDASEPGSGKSFDWNSMKKLHRDERTLVLAGGLNSGNVAAAIKNVRPDVVDVSSGIEYPKDSGRTGKDAKKNERICPNGEMFDLTIFVNIRTVPVWLCSRIVSFSLMFYVCLRHKRCNL